MRSMNSRCAGGWNRRLSFEAILYSLSVMGSRWGFLTWLANGLTVRSCTVRRSASIAAVRALLQLQLLRAARPQAQT